jgi:hypothetical protein
MEGRQAAMMTMLVYASQGEKARVRALPKSVGSAIMGRQCDPYGGPSRGNSALGRGKPLSVASPKRCDDQC